MSGPTRRLQSAAATLMAAVLALAVLLAGAPGAAAKPGDLARFLTDADPAALVPDADRFGPTEGEPAVVPAYAGDALAGYVFLNSDFTNSTGYSGRPIDVLVGVTTEGVIAGLDMVEHHEPIVLIGIPESEITAYLQGIVGYDAVTMTAPADKGDPDIISGATVTVLVIHDSVTRAAAKVARRLGLGGLDAAAATAAPVREIATDAPVEVKDWQTLLGEGSVRRLRLTVGEVNEAFAALGDPKAAKRPEPGQPDDTFIDLYVAQVSVPTIGRSLLGENEWTNLQQTLEEGQSAILVMGQGRYSFKGSGYVRGGIFDRIQLAQDTASIRFRDRQHKRLGGVAAEGAPDFTEVGVFRVPSDAGFVPALPWQLDLLVARSTGALEKAFVTFDLSYAVPEAYLTEPPPPPAAVAAPATDAGAQAVADDDEAGARDALWKAIWRSDAWSIGLLSASLVFLTAVFFFQDFFVRRPKLLKGMRYAFLTYTLVWIGWITNAQLSVVNLLTLSNSLATGFSWQYFLMGPLVFILWFAVAASLLFWGRGPFCGWLCPFGALQELTNHAGRRLKIRQISVPWGLHERLWPIKYIVFLALFGLALYDLAFAEKMAEVEPFKTAIILNFVREWPFVLFAVALLVAGLFIERFFCRYLCPLGGALAIPGRVRMFEWLKRWPECGTSCSRCARECPVQSIHPEGHINPNECIYCMHCQELYRDDFRCPHNVTRRLKKERRHTASKRVERDPEAAPTSEQGPAAAESPRA
ncbi:NosR/NirI family protein [Caenispirillum bisanense]|uniref:NosR/NirI family transcriptional regulator, nitrous oxide reductase regulator n=1 Tax=Caenispirillum bisanense TaxID=414052 RepID=A0A286GVL8_9PROT|nr:NosR/NirI family protein [Caenispirillum bisanense]SOD99541.1 NosR/NirI family transcriptional regulator, nitrous oxide reductase regulator [Caenispirillum bisanense]